jgi:hypothetical protein
VTFLAGSEMGDLQTFFWIVIEGVTALIVVAVLTILAVRELVRMWRSGESRLLFFITAGSVFTFFAFAAIATFGVTYGVFHYHGP